MYTDPGWLYSTIAQSSTAIVAIIGGFITASVLSLSADKRGLTNQKRDKEAKLTTLRKEKETLSKDLDIKEVQSFIEYITDKIIYYEELPSLEEMMRNNPETQNLNLETLNQEYQCLCERVIAARNFIKSNVDKMELLNPIAFDEWVKTNNLNISSYEYEILEKEYYKQEEQMKKLIINNKTIPAYALQPNPYKPLLLNIPSI